MRLTPVLGVVARCHLLFLILSILELKFQQLFALLRVDMLPLLEVLYLNQQLLLVHLSFHVIEHGYGNVIDDLQLFVNLRQHEYFLRD